MTASFTGLTPNGQVTVTADDNFVSDIVQVISKQFYADAQGNLSVKLILKDGVAPGTLVSVTATDETTQTSTTVTSTVPATGEGTPSGNQGQVPQTGAAIMPYAVAAVLLIAAGIAVFAARKSSARRLKHTAVRPLPMPPGFTPGGFIVLDYSGEYEDSVRGVPGNICRSPIGELLLPRSFLPDPAITADSAGTHGLLAASDRPQQRQDPGPLADRCQRLPFKAHHLADRQRCRSDSRIRTAPYQRGRILGPQEKPTGLSAHRFRQYLRLLRTARPAIGAPRGPERLVSAAAHASLIRPLLPSPKAIADPYRKEYADFVRAHNEICTALARIAQAIAQR